MPGRLWALTGVVVGLALAAAPAYAGTASLPLQGHQPGDPRGGGPSDVYRFEYRAGAGESSRLTVSGQGVFLRIEDSGAPIEPGANCRSDGPNAVACSPEQSAGGVPAFLTSATFDLGDGDDHLTLEGLQAQVTAGPGDDQVRAEGAPVSVDGGPGADLMRGKLPSRVTYAGRAGGVTVIQDGLANDGEADEHDNVGPGFSYITGGDGNDELHLDGPNPDGSLVGGLGDDRLFGARSGDTIDAGPGDDELHGAEGTDQLHGGPGADLIRGGEHRDILPPYGNGTPVDITLDDRPGDGPPGEDDDVGSDVELINGTVHGDRLIGSDNDDILRGGGGQNTVDGRGGADVLSGGGRLVGGPGADLITTGGEELPNALVAGEPTVVEALDGEHDTIACAPGSPQLTIDPFDALGGCAPVVVGPRPERLRVTREGTVRLRLRCERGSDIQCVGRIYARDFENDAVVGRARFSLPASGRSAVVEVRLTRRYRAELRRARRLLASFHLVTYRTAPAPSKRLNFVPARTLLAPR